MSERHSVLEGILSNGQKDDLERLCNRYGFDQILDALADIASAKAEHVLSVWEDSDQACRWTKLSYAIDAASGKSVGL